MSKSENNCDGRISVIIPVYNTEKYLGRCLDSVISNTYKDLEIICINDGSMDNSLSILREYEKKDNRISVIDIKNKGVSHARNIGLKNASGDIISFIDSDDWVHSHYFEILLEQLKEYNSDMAVCTYCRTSEFDIEKTKTNAGECNVQLFTGEDNLNQYVIKSYIWGRLYRSESIKGIFFLEDINVSEDKAFNISVLSNSQYLKVCYVNMALYFYYNRADSVVNNTSGLELKKLSKYYLEQVEKNISNKYSAKIYLNEAFSNSVNTRYLTMFSRDAAVKKEINHCLKQCIYYQRKYKLFNKSLAVKFWILYRFPIVYRTIRILTDRTMLDWERNEKKKNSQNEKSS